jgi:acyl-coenzyme A synthetase/AMP-(fatty) acid ligase
MKRSLSDFFATVHGAADPVAFDGDGIIDVNQFHQDVAANVARLRKLSCQQGVLLCADTYWAAVGLLSLFHAGATVILPSTRHEEGLTAFVSPDDIVVTDQRDNAAASTLVLEEGTGERASLVALDAERCSISLFTSGSTAQPKRVVKTLRQLDAEASIIETLFGASLPAVTQVHATVPHHHLYGLTFGLIWPLVAGRPFNRQVHEIWETVFSSDLRDAVLVTSPAHLTRLAGFATIKPERNPAMILSAGAALPALAAADAVDILSRAPTEIFGSTETGAIACRHWDEADPLWSPLPGVTVNRLPDGRMSVLSPFLANDQPFISADLIELQADGRFRALGRSDDICKIEGKRISLSMVEVHLRRLAGVAEAAAVVLEDGRPRLGAVVKLDAAGTAELAKAGMFRFGVLLRRRLAAELDTASLPKRWRFVAEMPSHALGKRRNVDLQALFAGNTMTTPTPAKDEPDVRATRLPADAGAAGIELDLFIDPSLPQLDGHFPNLPIVPGVALIDWAVRFAGRYLQIGDGVARSLQVKFRRIMTPDRMVTLTLEHQPARNRLAFTYRQGDQVLASGSFLASL